MSKTASGASPSAVRSNAATSDASDTGVPSMRMRFSSTRFAPLVKEEAVSKQDYDDAVTQLKSAEAQVNSARSTLDRAKLNLGYTRITAPVTGSVTLMPSK